MFEDDLSPASAVYQLVCRQARDLKRVNVPYPTILEATGLDPYVLEVALDHLAQAGLCAAWDPGSGPCATLTPLAARRLGLKLRRADGPRGGCHWVPADRREPKQRRAPVIAQAATDLGVNLDSIPGNSPRPDEVAEAAEDLDSSAPRADRRLSDEQSTRLPRPAILLEGSRAWPGGFPGQVDHDGQCPACRGEPLRPSTYCLVCDGWGLDWLVGRIRRDEASADAREKAAAKAKALATRLRPKGSPIPAAVPIG